MTKFTTNKKKKEKKKKKKEETPHLVKFYVKILVILKHIKVTFLILVLLLFLICSYFLH